MPDVGGIAGAQLKAFIERIERLEEEKRALGEDIKEVYAEAKGTGFEPKCPNLNRIGCIKSRPISLGVVAPKRCRSTLWR